MLLCQRFKRLLILQEINMKRLKIILIATIIMLCGCTDWGSNESGHMAERDIFAMDTFMNLKAYGEQADNAIGEASEKITELEDMLSVTDEKSDIWKINHANGSEVNVNEDTLRIIDTAIDIGNKTNGSLDITVYPVLKEWGFTTGSYKIPDDVIITQLLERVDYFRVKTNTRSVTIPQDHQIDLGALAKGYTGDRIIEILSEHGIESAIINLGGNVQTMGRKPDGSLWNVAVTDPFSPNSNLCVVAVENKAVITSGSYERYFVGEDGKKYWHIIDPSDGYPADNGLVSVTIIGESGLMCDALSTALFVAGTENSVEYWNSSGENFDMILITDEGKMLVTEDIEQDLTVIGNYEYEVIYHE